MFLVNGLPADTIPVTDRGFQYADGLFETVAVNGGKPLLFDAHLERLSRGCAKLGIALPDREQLRTEAQQVCGGAERQVLKITITRGSGGRGYRPDSAGPPTRVVAALPWPDYPAAHREKGVAVRLCRTRLGINPDLAGLKHLARLEQVLARGEWDDTAIQEGLMLGPQSQVVEGTMSNIFLVQDASLVTPLIDQCGVRGIMRDAVMACATRMGIPCAEKSVTVDDLRTADGMFLTNSLIGLWPVTRFEQHSYAIPSVMPALLARLLEEQACV